MTPIHRMRFQMWTAVSFSALFAFNAFYDATRPAPFHDVQALLDCAVAITEAGRALVYRKVAKALSGTSLTHVMRAEKLATSVKAIEWVSNVVFSALLVVQAMSDLVRGDYSAAVLDALMVWFVWWMNRRGKGGRDAAMKLLGEKSEALRRRLVESMPQGSPVAGGVSGS